MSLVPIAALGQRYGVAVAGIDSIIRLACIVHRTDYWRRGRTLDKTRHRQSQRERTDALCGRGNARVGTGHKPAHAAEWRARHRSAQVDPARAAG